MYPPRSSVTGGQTSGAAPTYFTADLFARFKTICGGCHVDSNLGNFAVSAADFSQKVTQKVVDQITGDDPSRSLHAAGKRRIPPVFAARRHGSRRSAGRALEAVDRAAKPGRLLHPSSDEAAQGQSAAVRDHAGHGHEDDQHRHVRPGQGHGRHGARGDGRHRRVLREGDRAAAHAGQDGSRHARQRRARQERRGLVRAHLSAVDGERRKDALRSRAARPDHHVRQERRSSSTSRPTRASTRRSSRTSSTSTVIRPGARWRRASSSRAPT